MSTYGQDLAHHDKVIQVKGHSGVHSYSPEETAAFSEHFNIYMSSDPDLAHLLPINSSSNELLTKVHDGLLLAKFINIAVRDTIDTRALNKLKAGGKELSLFQINENQTLVIASAKAVGVKVTNIGASELINGKDNPTIVLGLVWQLVKIHLLNNINLKNHPELVRLLEPNEELGDLLRLPPEQLLLRWFNYHLKNAGHPKRISNFSGDVKDSEAYTVLLHQISPQTCDTAALKSTDPLTRANHVLDNARRLEVKAPIKGADIVSGNPRLNLIFTAAIFNQVPGLDPLTKDEMDKAGLIEDDVGDSREERAFRMWINSLGVDDLHINNLFEDSTDGLTLLKVLDFIHGGGLVDWKAVEKNPNNKFKAVSNCNYVVVLGKQLKFSLVNISGTDINAGNKKLVLALVWQMMRYHTLQFVRNINAKKFAGKDVTDDMIVQWANAKAKENHTNPSGISIASFKDGQLKSSLFFFDLLSAIEPRIIDWAIINHASTPEEALLNAKYAISVARKLGAVIFLLPEDIVEVKPKMMMTFIASIMALEK